MKSKTAPWVTSVVEMRVTPWSKDNRNWGGGTKKAGEIDETIETMAATVVDVDTSRDRERKRSRSRSRDRKDRKKDSRRRSRSRDRSIVDAL